VKVLLDHNLPHKSRTALAAGGIHEFVTASYLGWGILKNGELLSAAEASSFDVFVTGDRSLVHEQHLAVRRIAVVALSTNNWPIIRSFVPRILSAINRAVPGSFTEVDCGSFSR